MTREENHVAGSIRKPQELISVFFILVILGISLLFQCHCVNTTLIPWVCQVSEEPLHRKHETITQ